MDLSLRGLDGALMSLVEEAGRNVQRCGLLLHDLLVDYPEHATLAQDLKVCEREGLRSLRTGTDLAPHLVEIHRLENEGDRLQRDGVASLFAGGIDPMVVIRWKDIFESLEAAVDACETVAHVLEGITLKQRRRSR